MGSSTFLLRCLGDYTRGEHYILRYLTAIKDLDGRVNRLVPTGWQQKRRRQRAFRNIGDAFLEQTADAR